MELFGLRPAELNAMRVKDDKLKIGNVKRNEATAKAHKPDRVAYPLEIPELAGALGQALAQLSSGLVKVPVGILNAQDFKTCGHTFRQYLDRHPYWAALVEANPGLSPTAFGMATPTEEPLPACLSDSSPHQWGTTCAPT